MRNLVSGRTIGLLLLTAWALCCSSRRPTPPVDDARVSGGGNGAAAAVHKPASVEAVRRGEAQQPIAVQEQPDPTGPQVGYAVAFGRSTDARSLPPASPSGEVGEINELNDEIDRVIVGSPSFTNGDATIRPGHPSMRALATSALQSLPSSTSFEGLADVDNGAGLVNPSDSNGAVGPNHYVEVVNNRVRVYDKSGNPLTPPFRQSSLFASVGGLCATVDDGDPIVLYDKLADRWQLSQFAFTATNAPPYHQCIAESVNGDPAGQYYVYDFQLPSNNFPDYPKLATWPDAYYLATRQFLNGGPFNGEGAIAFDRKKMLAGDPTATLIYFSESNGGNGLSFSSSGMLPSDFDGLLPPPPGTANVFAIYTAAIFGDPQGNALRLFDFHVDFDNPLNSTFTERLESPIVVADFDPLNPPGRADIEQPPPALINPILNSSGQVIVPSDNLDSIGDRLMYRLQYRNRDGVESLVAVHTVNVGVHLTNRFPTPAEHQAAPRYYELRRSTPGGAFAIFDQATFSPDAGNPVTGLNRWMGSAAIDNQGNLVVGYSTSSPTVFPSVNFAGRAFNETGGLLQGEGTIFAGSGSQIGSGNRWGDYSALQLDPTDECTFFYVNEYYPPGDRNTNQFNFHTRVGSFRFASCTPPARGMIQGKVTDCVTGLPIVGALVTASDGHSDATAADGTYSISVPPGSYTVAASDSFRNCNPSGSQSVSVSDGGTATANFCLTGNSKLDLGAVTIDDSLGNNNGIVNRDECVKLTIGISNDGCIADSNISATLTTSTPGVSINQALSAYPDLVVNTSGTNITPYAFTTSPSFACGTPID
ncbi:MAG TPA: carboxypeptidase-like regulatory domain-containing protein, partial [Thermoanaerobaculia bacterium]